MDKLDPPLFNGVPIIKEWIYRGLPCRVIHTRLSYCGYVGIPKEHPMAKFPYYEIDIEVHGGITFREEAEGIIWYGFDCAHAGDEIALALGGKTMGGHHWTLDEVVEETNRMARQFKKAKVTY